MTHFEYIDHDGDRLSIAPAPDCETGGPSVSVTAAGRAWDEVTVHVPLDRVEEVIAGIRDAARQAAAAGVPS